MTSQSSSSNTYVFDPRGDPNDKMSEHERQWNEYNQMASALSAFSRARRRQCTTTGVDKEEARSKNLRQTGEGQSRGLSREQNVPRACGGCGRGLTNDEAKELKKCSIEGCPQTKGAWCKECVSEDPLVGDLCYM